MEYHTPDDRWEIFGFNSFEEYCDKAVVKGKFHPRVPKYITEAYIMAEYMMAHAYYHYPLYHEAFSKVLRIFEMAVKCRCQQFNIPIEYTNNRRNHIENKALKMLMDDLVKAEPAKGLKQQFEVARILRNSTMHPDRHVYSGALTNSYIKQSITLLNTIFLPELTFTFYKDELKKIQNLLSAFRERLLVMEVSCSRYLLTGISIKAAIQIGNEWNYLLIGHPIALNALENFTNHSYLKPLTFFVREITMSNNKVEAVNENNNEKLVIYATDHPTNIASYDAFVAALNIIDEKDRIMYNHNTSHEIGEVENIFWYEKLWKVIA